MPDRPFIDANVLLYLLSPYPAKVTRAEALARSGGVISVQVLNEFANVARRKFGATWPHIHVALGTLRQAFDVIPVDIQTHGLGLRLAERYQYRLYDSLLLAAALNADCTTFWSEGLHTGHVVEGRLTIRNPFV